jgi:two-component system cell cycle sensor histidine kinase/response regulator CckA
MLYQQRPALAPDPLDRLSRWLGALVVLAAGLSAGLLLWLVDQRPAAAIAVAFGVAAAALLSFPRGAGSPPSVPLALAPDYGLVGASLGLNSDPCALTDFKGALLIANPAYRERFGGSRPPLELGADEEALKDLELARTMATRDGTGCVAGVASQQGSIPVEVERVGAANDLLLWRFPRPRDADPLASAARNIQGEIGDHLAAAGVLAAVIDANGAVCGANSAFRERAGGRSKGLDNRRFDELVTVDESGEMRLTADGDEGYPLRAAHIPLDSKGAGMAGTYLLFDQRGYGGASQETNLQVLLDLLPIGLALVDRDGRFLTMSKAFRQAAALKREANPAYPGDLVVKEDKAAVADAVRRNARGPAMSGDLAVRLSGQESEPVALTIAGLRGLGEAAVLLLLKDNSEEAKLKRQVAQATKMQVVGQLAGGVAHDFNNILTAIIGHCDLMLMRHTPGDSDYGDIQQIKSNSNRAAGLTRQLLAFSRQQTLRPQVLQLPDVVSEVSHLLKRLLGETVELVVKHGRRLGPVRADPGQLEQVIVNLAVNARDAMAATGGGALTIQTYAVRADQVAELGSDILPIADYSALSVSDTGCGIPARVLGKIFEPFFTTKEVGKGTGLGLSTVYGIVKQSGGFIFADSKVGEGTRFVIYLPVYREDAAAAEVRTRKVSKPKQEELWGSGTILLVEDEPMVRGVAERALTRHGYSVVTADNGEQALDLLRENEKFDLLISDVVMPGMDGPTMVSEARKTWPDLKILFMSGYAEEQLRKSIDIQNVNFLAKPFSVTELAEATRRSMGTK